MRHRFVPLVFLAAACVQRPADTITTTSGGTIAPDTAVAGIALDPIEESAPLVELEVATSERAGLYVIDMSGRPVYALVRSGTTGTGGTVTVDCTGACAQDFLPVIGRPRVETSGAIDTTILGTVRRGDGTRQVTLNGMPLWRYKGDQVSTHTRGHGMTVPGGTARLVWPDGKVATEF